MDQGEPSLWSGSYSLPLYRLLLLPLRLRKTAGYRGVCPATSGGAQPLGAPSQPDWERSSTTPSGPDHLTS